ncbi:MAG TPA: hypothetical protein VMW84_03900, partial [Acidobacteriota bacterium]|nr:hypothetical protein [Acidobacteriota bacterium]
QNVGTGYGSEVDHAVRKVSFERDTKEPYTVQALYYNDRAALVAQGIIVEDQSPNPFPAEKNPQTPAPPGWKG